MHEYDTPKSVITLLSELIDFAVHDALSGCECDDILVPEERLTNLTNMLGKWREVSGTDHPLAEGYDLVETLQRYLIE